MADKKSLIKLLSTIADLMEFSGENAFKINAFRSGANVVRRMEENIESIIAEKNLHTIRGIGKGLQAVIYEYSETGKSEVLEELRKSVPAGIEELFSIRGIGPKKIKTLHTELGISNIGELEYACRENRIALLKGFGEATQTKILTEIENKKKYSRFLLLSQADLFAEKIEAELKEIKSIKKLIRTGELRRMCEIVSSIEFVCLTDNSSSLLSVLPEKYEYEENENCLLIKTELSVPVKLYIAEEEKEYIRLMFTTTGSVEFLERLNIDTGSVAENSEEGIFKSSGVEFIIPEMRENQFFEIKSEKLKNNSDLEISEFRGLLHFHTTYSDGRNTLQEMFDEAVNQKFSYAAVCDHSRSAFYANGLDEKRVLKQKEEIRKYKKKLTCFHGIESDILSDGSLDYPEEILQSFDFIVASIHSNFLMSEDEMTGRIIKAVENPHTDLLAHPSGRLLLSRDQYKFNVKKVIDACASNDVAIEINANPRRLDLDWRNIFYAREKGCMFSINPDAHSTDEIGYIKYGVGVARKAGLSVAEVINCFDTEEFIKFLNRKVNRTV